MATYEVDYSFTIRGSHLVEANDKESAEKILSVMPLSELASLPGALDWEVEAVEVE